MRRAFLVTVGSAILATACGTAEVPDTSTAAVDPPPAISEAAPAAAGADADAYAPVAPPTRERPLPTPAAEAHGPSARAAASAADANRASTRPAVPAADANRPTTRRAEPAPAQPVPEYREVILPAGTVLPLQLTSAVSSDGSQVEDAVRAALRQDVPLEGGSVLPAGSEISGRVTDVERAGRVKGRARVAIRFTLLKHDGDEYDVRTEVVERVAAATKGEDAAKVGVGAGAGAAIGAILGGGSGAAKGAAIGAAAGTGAVLATRGEEIRLEPGAAVDTRLTAPVPVRVRVP